jgi:hypothetical protein
MRRRPWFTLAVVLTLLGLLGMAVAVAFNWLAKGQDNLALSISRAGVGVALTTVAGAVITGALRYLDERRWRDQERRRVFHEVVEAYNNAKSARRGLKAFARLGDKLTSSDESTSSGSRTTPDLEERSDPEDPQRAGGAPHRADPLRAEEIGELRATMTKLNEAQLRFEAINREVGQSALFKRKNAIQYELRAVEKYINDHGLEHWEKHRADVREGECPLVLQKFHFQEFIRFFEWGVSGPLDRLTRALDEELFGRTR